MSDLNRISREARMRVLLQIQSLMSDILEEGFILEDEEFAVARKISSGDLKYMSSLNDTDREAVISIILDHWSLEESDTEIAIDLLTAQQ